MNCCLPPRVVSELWERLVVVSESAEVHEGVGAVALHRHDAQVATEVPATRFSASDTALCPTAALSAPCLLLTKVVMVK